MGKADRLMCRETASDGSAVIDACIYFDKKHMPTKDEKEGSAICYCYILQPENATVVDDELL